MVSPLYGSPSPASSQSPSQSRVANESQAQRIDLPGQAGDGAKSTESAGKPQRQVIRTPEDAINVSALAPAAADGAKPGQA
ncbi:MAG: hypothetical protein MH208_12220 [Marinobacter sp.]|nr:hypothetical protein [Marinobacter sp.]